MLFRPGVLCYESGKTADGAAGRSLRGSGRDPARRIEALLADTGDRPQVFLPILTQSHIGERRHGHADEDESSHEERSLVGRG